MKKQVNARGFGYLEFTDTYGSVVQIKQSSSAEEAKLWIGVKDIRPQIMAYDARSLGLPDHGQQNGWVPFEIPKEVVCMDQMHVNIKQVKKIIAVLQHWVDSKGDLPNKI